MLLTHVPTEIRLVMEVSSVLWGRGAWERSLCPHLPPKSSSAAASCRHPEMRAQCCQIWVFHTRGKSKCSHKISQFSNIGSKFSFLFCFLMAKLSQSVGWIQSTGHQFAASAPNYCLSPAASHSCPSSRTALAQSTGGGDSSLGLIALSC